MHSFSRASLIALAASAVAVAASSQYLTFIGNFGTEIPAFRLDTATGKLTSVGPLATTKSPAWVTISANGKFLYAVNENADGISAFALNSNCLLYTSDAADE